MFGKAVAGSSTGLGDRVVAGRAPWMNILHRYGLRIPYVLVVGLTKVRHESDSAHRYPHSRRVRNEDGALALLERVGLR